MVGTPAYRAGVQSGDRIVKIAGDSTAGMNIDDAVRKLKGELDLWRLPDRKAARGLIAKAVEHPGRLSAADQAYARARLAPLERSARRLMDHQERD